MKKHIITHIRLGVYLTDPKSPPPRSFMFSYDPACDGSDRWEAVLFDSTEEAEVMKETLAIDRYTNNLQIADVEVAPNQTTIGFKALIEAGFELFVTNYRGEQTGAAELEEARRNYSSSGPLPFRVTDEPVERTGAAELREAERAYSSSGPWPFR